MRREIEPGTAWTAVVRSQIQDTDSLGDTPIPIQFQAQLILLLGLVKLPKTQTWILSDPNCLAVAVALSVASRPRDESRAVRGTCHSSMGFRAQKYGGHAASGASHARGALESLMIWMILMG